MYTRSTNLEEKSSDDALPEADLCFHGYFRVLTYALQMMKAAFPSDSVTLYYVPIFIVKREVNGREDPIVFSCAGIVLLRFQPHTCSEPLDVIRKKGRSKSMGV